MSHGSFLFSPRRSLSPLLLNLAGKEVALTHFLNLVVAVLVLVVVLVLVQVSLPNCVLALRMRNCRRLCLHLVLVTSCSSRLTRFWLLLAMRTIRDLCFDLQRFPPPNLASKLTEEQTLMTTRDPCFDLQQFHPSLVSKLTEEQTPTTTRKEQQLYSASGRFL